MKSPLITVLIVNYNAGPRLLECLRCVGAQTFGDFETIVIDNGSTDFSAHDAIASGANCRLIEAGSNLGFAAANNRAAKEAKGEWIAFLNPDAYPDATWLAELVAAAQRYPNADAFGSTQLDAKDPTRIDGAGDVFHVLGIPYRGHFGRPIEQLPADGECFAPCAAAAMYRRRVFEDLGGFDERFFCYVEDVDLGFRLRLSGKRAIQVNRARVRHEGSGLTGRYSDFTVYHGNRNRIWATYKNMPGALYWPLLPAHLAANLYFLLRATSTGAGRPYLKALRDGFGRLGEFRSSRREIQSSRRVSVSMIAKHLAWSPFLLMRRTARLRPIDPAPSS